MKNSLKHRSLIMIPIALIAGALLTHYQFSQPKGDLPRAPYNIEKAFAKEFSALTYAPHPADIPPFGFQDKSGKTINSTDLKGQTTLLNVWATWCTPCIAELPALQAFDEQNTDINVIAVSMDTKPTIEPILDFLKNREIGDFAAYWDHKSELKRALPMRGIPTTYLIGPDGLILYRFEGDADWTGEAATAFFNALKTEKE